MWLTSREWAISSVDRWFFDELLEQLSRDLTSTGKVQLVQMSGLESSRGLRLLVFCSVQHLSKSASQTYKIIT